MGSAPGLEMPTDDAGDSVGSSSSRHALLYGALPLRVVMLARPGGMARHRRLLLEHSFFRGAKNGFERRLSSHGDFRTDRGFEYANGEPAVCLTPSGDKIRGVDVVGSSILP